MIIYSVKWVIILLFVFTVFGCRRQIPIVKNGKSLKFIKKEYVDIPLLWSEYIYYHDSVFQGRWHEGKVSLTPQDSVLNLLKKSFLKIEHLNIKIGDTLINKVSTEITKSLTLRPKRINDGMIIKHVQDSASYLFPVFYSARRRNFTISGGYTFSYKSFSGRDNIEIVIYVINNKKVIYKRNVRLYAVHANNGIEPQDFTSQMKPEYWDLIVQKAMEDYIKRLKKN